MNNGFEGVSGDQSHQGVFFKAFRVLKNLSTQPYKRIVTLFLTDCCSAHVTGIHDDVVRQDKQFVVNAGFQDIKISAGQVGTADGAREQGVSHKNRSLCEKGYASR